MLGTNRFFHPINKQHVYNSVCVLVGRTPKAQLRSTDDKYLPMFNDIEEAVSDGYIKIMLVSDSEKITTIKKDWNANITTAQQYTWIDASYVLGSLLPKFIAKVSDIFEKDSDSVKAMPFDNVFFSLQSMGFKNEKDEIQYDNEKINELISWCKINSATAISNYIENKQLSSKSSQFGKRVHRGVVDANKYCGEILIPFNDDLFNELIKYTKGFSKILDGGFVTYQNPYGNHNLIKWLEYCPLTYKNP